jgi:hypothetical protein
VRSCARSRRAARPRRRRGGGRGEWGRERVCGDRSPQLEQQGRRAGAPAVAGRGHAGRRAGAFLTRWECARSCSAGKVLGSIPKKSATCPRRRLREATLRGGTEEAHGAFRSKKIALGCNKINSASRAAVHGCHGHGPKASKRGRLQGEAGRVRTQTCVQTSCPRGTDSSGTYGSTPATRAATPSSRVQRRRYASAS